MLEKLPQVSVTVAPRDRYAASQAAIDAVDRGGGERVRRLVLNEHNGIDGWVGNQSLGDAGVLCRVLSDCEAAVVRAEKREGVIFNRKLNEFLGMRRNKNPPASLIAQLEDPSEQGLHTDWRQVSVGLVEEQDQLALVPILFKNPKQEMNRELTQSHLERAVRVAAI